MKKIIVLTGAGVSADSGINTFRDADGLWEGHDVMEVATPQGFQKNPELVLNFYNERRRQLFNVSPNEAHKALARLEEHFDVSIITQNVDDLHERAGSSKVIHLHGELLKARCSHNPNKIIDWKTDIKIGDLSEDGKQLRPHIVWFGEEVPLLEKAANIAQTANILIIIGTSMQVYPAASLIHYVPRNTPIFFIDPKPNINQTDFNGLTIIKASAAKGVPLLVSDLITKKD
ncbi:NAD-dependent deacylase [Arenibacter sp. F26102]|uniref:SIR2 family NAD-dependent protein deacylase n=1 Tax=Arenibacter sp. F26102 TaxID=2926416 RepID=UPI001FF65AB0|nr:NAD-dependent deacylase [Arenibacter sp. F26102]MCK0147008.1 NAD-dependent deacylase [Arenibacter sp. F26102]